MRLSHVLNTLGPWFFFDLADVYWNKTESSIHVSSHDMQLQLT
jgi:hypothetical protein